MALEWIYPMKDQERLIFGQYVDWYPPSLVVRINNSDLQVWSIRVIFAFEAVDLSS